MTEKDVVKKFIDSPFQLCGDGFDLTGGPEIRNHYRNWVALLHILLVKHEKKKGFVFSNPPDTEKKNMIRICQKLKLPLKQTDAQITEIIGKTRKMPESLASDLVKLQPTILRWMKVPTWIASINEAVFVDIDWNTFDAKKDGKMEGFPDCCVDAFIERLWNDFEFGWDALTKTRDENEEDAILMKLMGPEYPMLDYPEFETRLRDLENQDHRAALRHVYFILLTVRHPNAKTRIPRVLENNAKRVVDYARMFRKYPFLLHLACEDCLSDENSPSATMNDDFSKFCKNEYPELYERIVDDASTIDPQKQKSRIQEYWFNEMGYHFQL